MALLPVLSSFWNGSFFGGIPKLLIAIICVVLIPVLTFGLSSFRYQSAIRESKTPPTIPYYIPLLGHLFSFGLDPVGFTISVMQQYGWERPFKVKMGFENFTILCNPEHINQVFRSSKEFTSKPGALFAVKYIFGTPPECVPFYEADDTGMAATPKRGSAIKQEDRIHYHQHHAGRKYLTSPHLSSLAEKFIDTLSRNLDVIGSPKMDDKDPHEWIELPDLYLFLQHQVASAVTETFMGSEILRLHPGLIQDYIKFEKNVPKFTRCLPRWMIPREYRQRDKLRDAVKEWQSHGHLNSDCNAVSSTDPEWEPYFGSKFAKARQQYTGKMEAMSADACAAEDLGLIFATNSNSTPSIFWFVFEALRDNDLLARLLAETSSCLRPDLGATRFDLQKLSSQPLLQSVFAETLRLRVASGVIRVSEHKPVEVAGYTIEPNQHLLVSTRPIALKAEAWSRAGRPPARPLEQFHAERFLVPKPTEAEHDKTTGPPRRTDQDLHFSLDGLEGCWLPFGGGQRMCPGRHFAKQEIISTFALLFHVFDIELSPKIDPNMVQPDMKWVALGGLPPVCQVPFRIKRKV